MLPFFSLDCCGASPRKNLHGKIETISLYFAVHSELRLSCRTSGAVSGKFSQTIQAGRVGARKSERLFSGARSFSSPMRRMRTVPFATTIRIFLLVRCDSSSYFDSPVDLLSHVPFFINIVSDKTQRRLGPCCASDCAGCGRAHIGRRVTLLRGCVKAFWVL